MRPASLLAVCLVAAAPLASAAGKRSGLEMTVCDTFDFKIRVGGLTLKKKAEGVGAKPPTLEYIPLLRDGHGVNLWLAQVATATFAAKDKGQVAVKAVLQGKGDKVEGVVEKARAYWFAGRVAKGSNEGRPARFPLLEVKSLENHTPYEGAIGAGTITVPMPGPDQDVLWVSSVPFGGEVWIKAFEGVAAKTWQEYARIGKTPAMQQIPPGKYAVKVMVPGRLATTLRPATKLGEDAVPFENDWGQFHFRPGQNTVLAVEYTVVKRAGKAAALISLFQKKGQSLAEVVGAYPEGQNFRFDVARTRQMLEKQGMPADEVALVLDALHRGGKIIWHGKRNSLMFQVTPGGGVSLGGASRPTKK